MPGSPSLFDGRFAALSPPRLLLAGPGVESDVQLGAVSADGLFAGAAVQAVRYGRGHLVLSTLPFTADTLQDPLAARLLENVVRWSAGIAGRKPPPPPTEAAAPGAEHAEGLARMVWRAQIVFGIAERLAQQSLPGRPQPRDELPDLATMVARKSGGLDLVIAGRCEAGMDILQQLDRTGLDEPRERFLRAEIALADNLAGRTALLPPLPAPVLHEVLEAHARAARLMRLGETDAALEQFGVAASLLAGSPGKAAAGAAGGASGASAGASAGAATGASAGTAAGSATGTPPAAPAAPARSAPSGTAAPQGGTTSGTAPGGAAGSAAGSAAGTAQGKAAGTAPASAPLAAPKTDR